MFRHPAGPWKQPSTRPGFKFTAFGDLSGQRATFWKKVHSYG
jgi:hypothetical protein